MNKFCTRVLSFVLVICVLFSLTACDKEEGEVILPASYGSYGADFARKFALCYPHRKAYSEEEAQAGLMIKREFESLGYQVITQSFIGSDGLISNNYLVHIDGTGFVEEDKDGQKQNVSKRVVIGAHYDCAFTSEEVPPEYTFNGISDNASGIGVLVTIAKYIDEYKGKNFDIDIVAFGASTDDYAGARHYYNSLSAEDKMNIDAMFCIENIYAGDKVYANSGMNSLVSGQKYAMRRKLYQAYDVAYNDMLSSLNNFNLLYNESNIVVDLNGDGVEDVYREVSLNTSDYSVFDSKNIPVVFFDSGDYFFSSFDKKKETKNLNLQEFGGMISNTYLDSSIVLDKVLVSDESDLLEVRINNIAYIILGVLDKGSDNAMTEEQYLKFVEDRDRAQRLNEETAASVSSIQ